ncbi:MAG: hypothetical protein NVSMB44_20030 [Ktedonobacteraceae bacterium]
MQDKKGGDRETSPYLPFNNTLLPPFLAYWNGARGTVVCFCNIVFAMIKEAQRGMYTCIITLSRLEC